MNMNIQFQKAFTLIELSVVLFIISLLMVGLLGPVGTQIESQERQQTIDTMDDIIESLYGFAVINGRLPCPDTDGDGTSDPVASGACTVGTGDGWLPWQTLGLNNQGDIWGNRFKYHVTTPGFTTIDTGTCAADGELDLCQSGDITIRTRGDDTSTGAILESKFQYNAATVVPAVIVSHGKNGLGATSVNGVTLTATTAGTDEAENDDANTDAIFYSRGFTEGAAGCVDDTNEATTLCQFDDIVMWVSPSVLMNRMVKAEVLP
ncbi:MAG: type II secretion system protein [Proteobacteria bacterium]|nr:type II secretion system protein [Pseudomonadota bacterium]NOG60444.1 type II secretion system protein [Pseudomonadota bacterium]